MTAGHLPHTESPIGRRKDYRLTSQKKLVLIKQKKYYCHAVMMGPNWRQLDLQFSSEGASAISTPPKLLSETESHRRRIVGYLTIKMPDPVDLVFTNNRSTMISFRRRRGRYALRLHRLFRHADERLLDHLSRYLTSPKKSDSVELDRFIAAHQEEIDRKRPPLRKTLSTEGETHDLQAILQSVCKTYFNGNVEVRIGWGRRPRRSRTARKRKRIISRALATYNFETRTILVCPVLDAPNVPRYVLEWIVYHEVLHHVLPIQESGGRRRYHTRQFRLLERAFIQYEAAKHWEENHLDQLLF